MGDEQSALPTDQRPTSLLKCLDLNGRISLSKYEQYKMRRVDEEEMQFMSEALLDLTLLDNDDFGGGRPRPKRSRRMKAILLAAVDDSGNDIPYVPTISPWYTHYVRNPNLSCPKFDKKFRLRFRLPYANYLELLEMVKADDRFERWKSCDATGRPSSPIELLVLGVLRVLGRGWTFDDLDEATAVGEETHRQFFHKFIEFGRAVLFERYVIQPTNAEMAAPHTAEYNKAGFHGAVGSTDATHVLSERIGNSIANHHSGSKLPGTARTFNITVNHRRRILSSTTGHPSRWNDKTLVRFDKFVTGIRNGKVLDDVEFQLLERDEGGRICSRRYQGAWLLVDNGYLQWATTMPPFKKSSDYKEIRWSEWLESMRKDVECTFGILKGRWRILKTGVRVHGTDAIDNIWCTCCALHNYLLEVDGLDETWEHHQSTDCCWEGNDGLHDLEDIPLALLRIHSPESLRHLDHTAMGMRESGELRDDNDEDETHGGDQGEDEEERSEQLPHAAVSCDDNHHIRIVRQLPFNYFRSRLVEHFDILFMQNKIQWPSRNRIG